MSEMENLDASENAELLALQRIDETCVSLQEQGRYLEALECMERGDLYPAAMRCIQDKGRCVGQAIPAQGHQAKRPTLIRPWSYLLAIDSGQ